MLIVSRSKINAATNRLSHRTEIKAQATKYALKSLADYLTCFSGDFCDNFVNIFDTCFIIQVIFHLIQDHLSSILNAFNTVK